MPNLTVVFTHANGYVTDMGETPMLVEVRHPDRLRHPDRPDGDADFTLPRYGVWKWHAGKHKWQVDFTTNNLEEATAKAKEDR